MDFFGTSYFVYKTFIVASFLRSGGDVRGAMACAVPIASDRGRRAAHVAVAQCMVGHVL